MTCMNHQKTPGGTCFQVHGQGETVVLIHGVGLDQSMWGGQLVALQNDYQVITYDMLGHGSSHRPAFDADLKDYAAQLKELIDFLAVSKVTVIGFSMGGLVARAFALHYPQCLNGLVVMNSVFNRSEEQRTGVLERTREVARKGPAANVESALKRWFSEEYAASSPAQVKAVRDKVEGNDHQGYLKTYELFASADNYQASKLSEVHVPALILTGELDSGSTPQMAVGLAECLPDARVVILDGERHMMPMESPRLVNQKLTEFLSDIYNSSHAQE